MDISIIIPSYNTNKLLDRCLSSLFDSLKNTSLTTEVIVVDNNSIDESVSMVEQKYPSVYLIKNKENIGYGKANNIAIHQAKGKYILLLNSDCIVKGDAINHLYEYAQAKFEKNRKIFVGGKLFNEDGTPQQSAGPFYTLPVSFLMLFTKGDHLHITRYSPDKERIVDWVSGACLLGTKDGFIDVGLFDESIFMYMEEIDLLYRAKKKGYTVWFCPSAEFIHTGAASSGNKREPVVQIYRGLDYFYSRHYSASNRVMLRWLLRLKAWFVIGICGIIGKQDVKDLYAKALTVLS